MHYMQPDVGHYGVFNGSRFRREIAPRILAFMAANRQPVADDSIVVPFKKAPAKPARRIAS
jgi:hypothetical protein